MSQTCTVVDLNHYIQECSARAPKARLDARTLHPFHQIVTGILHVTPRLYFQSSGASTGLRALTRLQRMLTQFITGRPYAKSVIVDAQSNVVAVPNKPNIWHSLALTANSRLQCSNQNSLLRSFLRVYNISVYLNKSYENVIHPVVGCKKRLCECDKNVNGA